MARFKRPTSRSARRSVAIAAACTVESLEARTLLSADIPDGYHFIETFAMSSEPGTPSVATSNATLVAGVTYFLKTSSVNQINTEFYDAEFKYTSTPVDTDSTFSGEQDAGFKAGGTGLLHEPHWDRHTYDSSHEYIGTVTGTGTQLSLVLIAPGYLTSSVDGEFDLYGPTIANYPPPSSSGGLDQTAFGAGGGQSGNEGFSSSGVRYADGSTVVSATDLRSDGFGGSWGLTRSWTNGSGFQSQHNRIGNGWMIAQNPYMENPASNVYAVVTGSGAVHYFDYTSGNYVPRNFDKAKLSAAGNEFTFTDTTGQTIFFNDFDDPTTYVPGQFKKMVDVGGNVTEVTSHSSGKIAEIRRSIGSGNSMQIESWKYSYVPSGVNADLISKIELRRGSKEVSTVWTAVREANYEYYGTGDSQGLPRDLKKVTLKDGASTPATLETYYYRYYASGADLDGYTHAIKMVFNPADTARLAANVANWDSSATDSAVEAYASQRFKYDLAQRVKEFWTQRTGSSTATLAGLGKFTYAYTTSNNTLGYNSWKTKTVETLPDLSTTNTIYSNGYGQKMLAVTQSGGSKWAKAYEYDSVGRLVRIAEPSGVVTSGSGLPTILSEGGTTYYLSSTGKETIFDYVVDDGEDEPEIGVGYMANVYLRNGHAGSDIKIKSFTYTSHTANSVTIYPVATSTRYRSESGDPLTTANSYDEWYSGTHQVKKQTVTLDAVETTQNGSGTANAYSTFFDSFGRATWTKDGDGYLNSYSYDAPTGAVTQTVIDAAEPGGTPPLTRGSGLPTALALTTNYTNDGLGRITSIDTARADSKTHIVYNDAAHETRIYPGFHAPTSTTGTTTGLITIVREYRPASSGQTLYYETLTTSATPVVSGSVPTGTETLSASNIQSLTRSLTNNAGQITDIDEYFSLSGVTYSQSTARLGTTSNNTGAGGNRHATAYAFDNRGRLFKATQQTGTITKSVFDALSRTTSVRIGTDDSGTGTDDMTAVVEYQYDGGGVGDGNLTKITEDPGAETDRVTDMAYDWRNRLIAIKSGVETSESTSVNRPLFTYTYDNLDQVTAVNQYDGDGESLTSPSSGKLRARSLTMYDDQGRVWRTDQVKVAYGSGSYSDDTRLLTKYWYDSRGNVIKVDQPGGLIAKMAYDGAGRLSKSYLTDDNAGDSSWSDADDVSGDYVLNQQEIVYDADSNVTFAINRDRFHNDTLTGALGDESTGPKARVSYTEYFYDKANRLTDSVDLGTAGGTNYTNPPHSTTPTRSGTELRTSVAYDDANRRVETTDPRGIVSRTSYDMLGRTTQTIEAYVNGTASNDDDRITNYEYNGSSRVTEMSADLGSGGHQETQYVYGDAQRAISSITFNGTTHIATVTATGHDYRVGEYVTVRETGESLYNGTFPVTAVSGSTFSFAVPTGSPGSVATGKVRRAMLGNDLLSAVKYPTKSGTGVGDAADSQKETFTYNALGDSLSYADRNVNVHNYGYDVLGRLTSDKVATLGSGVTGTRRLGYTFDEAGRPYQFFAYSDAAGSSPTHEVRRTYNDFGQLTIEHQDASGAVGTSTPKVQYAYSEDTSNNHSRLTSMTYPDSTTSSPHILEYQYTSTSGAAGIDSQISRLSYMNWSNSSSTHLEEYSYLGLGTVVKFAHPETGVDLNYIKLTGDGFGTGDAGDDYTGFDRFGRIVDQRYTTSAGSAADRFQYGYDENGNAMYRNNVLTDGSSGAADLDELYHADGATAGYDKLDRLTAFQRGKLSAAGTTLDTVSTEARSQSWSLDALGNWSSVTTNSTTENRTHNAQNQIYTIGSNSATYDANGNLTDDGSTPVTYVYDAWNRLVGITPDSSSSAAVVGYGYDALGRRVQEVRDTNAINDLVTTNHLYYSAAWQLIYDETSVVDNGIFGGGFGLDGVNGGVGGELGEGAETSSARLERSAIDRHTYVWSPNYIDAMVLRDADSNGDGTYEQRLYVQHDANFNVTALTDTSGAVVERYIYDPYGNATTLTPAWGSRSTSSYGWVHLFQGLRLNSGLYDMRMRAYSGTLGRALQNDPMGYIDGLNSYQILLSNPSLYVDPFGEDVEIIVRPLGGASKFGVAAKKGAKLVHVYLRFTYPNEPAKTWTVSYHPAKFTFLAKVGKKYPARLWYNDPTDLKMENAKALLVTNDPAEQQKLEVMVKQFEKSQQVGVEEGAPKADPENPDNQIGDKKHVPPKDDGETDKPGVYELDNQNCGWWVWYVIDFARIKVPEELEEYNIGIGPGRRTDTAPPSVESR